MYFVKNKFLTDWFPLNFSRRSSPEDTEFFGMIFKILVRILKNGMHSIMCYCYYTEHTAGDVFLMTKYALHP